MESFMLGEARRCQIFPEKEIGLTDTVTVDSCSPGIKVDGVAPLMPPRAGQGDEADEEHAMVPFPPEPWPDDDLRDCAMPAKIRPLLQIGRASCRERV